ncbi:unnamed protein product [Cylicocyclus nassatus]|uniref:Uncharacterized protein n=1 Tax=Cylicocyclus nassatus TaxID=53992 RepID=A0AA36H068_CYLNA|nr:unnamed protein product [Cylicocyclus nassatus]
MFRYARTALGLGTLPIDMLIMLARKHTLILTLSLEWKFVVEPGYEQRGTQTEVRQSLGSADDLDCTHTHGHGKSTTVSTKFKKSSKKKEYAKISEKELINESEKVVKSEKTQENEDEGHLQLMRKFLAQNDMSQPEKPFTVQDLPLWIALMDNTDDDKPTSELRLKMADWLLRRGGMDQLPKGISPVPLRSASSTTKSKGGEEIQYTRAPKGEQVDKLASMERFLEKLNSTEHFSGSGDSLEQVPLVTKVRTTKTTPQSKKSPKRAGAGGEMKEDVTQISTRIEEFLNDE